VNEGSSLGAAGDGRIPLVWLHDPDDTSHYWERDWLRFLLGDLPIVAHHAVDPGSPPLRNALVIVGNDIAEPAVRAYIASYARAGCRHGLIHLSDEYFRHDISWYEDAAVVFRTCYRPARPQNTFGLGYKQGFWDGYAGPSAAALTITERPYLWSFAGVIKKSDRANMLRIFRRIAPHVVHETSFWNSPDSLSTAAYRDLLLRTAFVPSPPGTYSLDCFRTYEALEAGCIPIVLRETAVQPFNYYQALFAAMGFAEPVPFPQVRDWREAAKVVTRLRAEPAAIERMRVDCHSWWQRYKSHTRARFTERVRRAFTMDQPPRWNSAT
jgi:hypothetical protein